MSVLIQLTDGVKSFGDQMLLDSASVTLYENEKVGFIGRNGAGKSTLLRVLLGDEELDSGSVMRSPNLRVGYLRQHDPFLPEESALDFLIRDSGQPDWKCGEVAAEFELKGLYLNGPVKGSVRRMADAREAGGVAAARSEPVDAGRTDQLSGPAHSDSARTFPETFSGGLSDRIARSRIPDGDLRSDARRESRSSDNVQRQDRRISEAG